jgi:hypothetical protein
MAALSVTTAALAHWSLGGAGQMPTVVQTEPPPWKVFPTPQPAASLSVHANVAVLQHAPAQRLAGAQVPLRVKLAGGQPFWPVMPQAPPAEQHEPRGQGLGVQVVEPCGSV